MHTVVETPASGRCESTGIDQIERFGIISALAANPVAGNAIEGTGGARKVRIAAKGKGKSGGYRVITFYSGLGTPVFLLNIFAKNEKASLTDREKQVLKVILSGNASA